MAFNLIQTKPQTYGHVHGLYLVIKHPAAESRVSRFLARAVLLALFIVSLPYFGSNRGGSSIASNNAEFGNENDIGIFSFEINEKSNDYRIVYLEQSDDVEKTKLGQNEIKSPSRRRLFAYESDAKRAAALNELEDVLLEPPRSASRKSRRYLQRTRYLPDLMDDSLESYPRHIFIDAGVPEKEAGGSGTSWFDHNYPTRNKKFEMYKIETVSTDQASSSKEPQVGISDWLSNNVKAEDYVVMKAEAEVVEDMMKSKVVRLVDELFLECKPQKNGGRKVSGGGRRAYWQCLALYGQLRDEGVAVHQWWG
ncbi:peptide upstream ORF protein [Cucumis melo var. makuwa]|uniref:Uncharacterized protein LOC103503664 n=2 Tax=Cucumis melo TaxID=3656 RepID=A0A1S3CQK9_CUCME|nr:uncharacterized protein LOC103503664 [Cucumis melo]KAA0038670.1 peptide upstream ORF protein [Cucumis melo var. makuwa]TYK31279.1 peptide upstream ORF protein [Cucumis melo var. makuwa]